MDTTHPASTATEILATIKSLGGDTKWVGLAKIRPHLAGTKAEQDATLKGLFRSQELDIIPEDNRKALRAEDHEAAIEIGGEDKHAARLAW
jgi:hypothetical protein